MKTCPLCGKEIINGVNRCQMMKVCFDCNGGFPDYSRNQSLHHWNNVDWNELDAAEGRCLREEN